MKVGAYFDVFTKLYFFYSKYYIVPYIIRLLL